MYKEDELGLYIPNNGYPGTLGQAGYYCHYGPDCEGPPGKLHKGMGWETFTDNIISYLSQREEPVIFVYGGKCKV